MRLLVVGAGGHAKVVVDAAVAAGFKVAGVLGTATDPVDLLGHAVSTNADDIAADGFIVAVGDNAVRSRLFAEHVAAGRVPVSVLHPSAIIGTDVVIGDGTFVAAGCVINTGAHIGADVILNTACSVDHDCVIEDHVHVAPQVGLSGAVTLGEGVLLGVGSCAAPQAAVGEWSVVGAGAAVVGHLPSHAVCVGVPARVLRMIGDQDRV